MVCRPFRASGVQEDKVYTQRMTGEGRRFKEREQERVLCLGFRKALVKGSLVTHHQTQNSLEKGVLGSEGDKADKGNNLRTYRLVFPAKTGPRPFSFEGCSG